MTATTSKAPTAQGISALLRKAGFERSRRQARSGQSTGYLVEKSAAHPGTVIVYHRRWSMLRNDDAVALALAGYGEALIAAGYEVTADVQRSKLTVCASLTPDQHQPEEGDR